MKTVFFFLFIFLAGTAGVFADETYTFNCKDSSVQGSISYALIGNYDFSFKDCSGVLSYDPLGKQVKSVRVRIKIRSISSNCPICDRAAVSRRLLHAAVFPFMEYQADHFEKFNDQYRVNGLLKVHGISRPLSSLFTLKQDGPKRLILKGQWLIRRADYKIIWNRVLDNGGVLVGEMVKVNWQVHAHK